MVVSHVGVEVSHEVVYHGSVATSIELDQGALYEVSYSKLSQFTDGSDSTYVVSHEGTYEVSQEGTYEVSHVGVTTDEGTYDVSHVGTETVSHDGFSVVVFS